MIRFQQLTRASGAFAFTRLQRCYGSTAAEAQKAHWRSYLASGRGSAALFGAIDSSTNDVLTKKEVQAFIANVNAKDDMLKKALQKLEAMSDEEPLTLREFQDWLVMATEETGYAQIQPIYESNSQIGARSGGKKKADNEEHHYNWNANTMSQSLRRMQYAVRGEVVMKADKLAGEGREIVYTNVGNPQSVGQQPITFYRQVLALCDLPAPYGVDHPNVGSLFPADVWERARELRDIIGPSGTGAYTHSQGLAGFRKHVASYIEDRDGHPAYMGDIFLTDGASSGIEHILTGLISNDHDAIMIPIPQYPIYSALITQLGGRKVGYYMDEDLGWAVTEEELQKRLDESRSKGLVVKGFALINPGNPTGKVMSRQDLETICLFCARNGIVLLADEVYQRNVYAKGREFISAKKVALETLGCEHLELASFHSTSKGLIGECGRRGGYMELHNIDPYVQSELYKLASSGLCPCTSGQIMTSLMVHGPKPGGESYDQFLDEEQGIFESLGRRADLMVKGLNSVDGITCQPAEGAMYCFPRLDIPDGAWAAAEKADQTPDTLYALSLLEEAGICVVPASGFGQKEGRVGFRTTFLPPEAQLEQAVDKIAAHHRHFCEIYA